MSGQRVEWNVAELGAVLAPVDTWAWDRKCWLGVGSGAPALAVLSAGVSGLALGYRADQTLSSWSEGRPGPSVSEGLPAGLWACHPSCVEQAPPLVLAQRAGSGSLLGHMKLMLEGLGPGRPV